MGITIAQLLKEVGGEGAKAVQVGGASGTCVPASPVRRRPSLSRASRREAPSSSSAPSATCCEVAKNFMEFFVEESCGQCTPCRYGNVALLEGIESWRRDAAPWRT